MAANAEPHYDTEYCDNGGRLCEHHFGIEDNAAGVAANAQAIADIDAGVLNGLDGADGINGLDGADGANGQNGADGRDGIDGVNGDAGINGINGIDGSDGAQGIQGVAGVGGSDGANGLDGADGKDGAKGDKGDTGAKGKAADMAKVSANARATQKLNLKLAEVDKANSAGVAAAIAMSASTFTAPAGKFGVAIGAGAYRGENAVAVTVGGTSDSGTISVRAGYSRSNDENAYQVGGALWF